MADDKSEQDSAGVSQKIDMLRKLAADGKICEELSDGLLEDVAGGVYFCDMIVHTEGHTESMGGE